MQEKRLLELYVATIFECPEPNDFNKLIHNKSTSTGVSLSTLGWDENDRSAIITLHGILINSAVKEEASDILDLEPPEDVDIQKKLFDLLKS